MNPVGQITSEISPMIMPPYEVRPLIEYPLYHVEASGQVWSQRTRKNGTTLWTKLCYCHSYTKVGGYPQIMLCCGMMTDSNGKLRVRKKLLTLHALVALAWLGPRPPGVRDPVTNTVRNYEVIHLQGDRQNPSLYAPDGSIRLRYGSHEDCMDTIRLRGRFQAGEDHRLARLTVVLVGEARRRAQAGESMVALAREYDVAYSTIQRAVAGQTWRQVP